MLSFSIQLYSSVCENNLDLQDKNQLNIKNATVILDIINISNSINENQLIQSLKALKLSPPVCYI